jgi:uncharacterized protein YjiS (DUF1127 family)
LPPFATPVKAAPEHQSRGLPPALFPDVSNFTVNGAIRGHLHPNRTGDTPMTTLAATRPVAAAPRSFDLGNRFVSWLLALDAGYRGAHGLAHTTEARLADMGITRTEAHAEFARHAGTIDTPTRTSGVW